VIDVNPVVTHFKQKFKPYKTLGMVAGTPGRRNRSVENFRPDRADLVVKIEPKRPQRQKTVFEPKLIFTYQTWVKTEYTTHCWIIREF